MNHQKFLLMYVRKPSTNERVGMVVATGPGKVGWSLCAKNKGDKFSKLGLEIATGRANKYELTHTPNFHFTNNDVHNINPNYSIFGYTSPLKYRYQFQEKITKMYWRSLNYFKGV